MGKRILAVLLSMVVVFCVLRNDVISVYAADPDAGYEEPTSTEEIILDEDEPEKPTVTSADEPTEEAAEEDKKEALEETNPDVLSESVTDVSADNVTPSVASDVSADEPVVIEPEVSDQDVSSDNVPDAGVSDNDISDNNVSGNDISGNEVSLDDTLEGQNSLALISIDRLTELNEDSINSEKLGFAGLFLSSKMLKAAGTNGAVVSLDDADDTNVPDENALMKSLNVTIEDSEGNIKPLDESKDTVVSLEDKIKVTYTFNEPLHINPAGAKVNDKIPGTHVVAGKRYKVPSIPKICARPEGYVIDVKSDDRILGHLNIDADGNAVLQISDTFTELETAMGAYAGLDLSLELDKDADGDTEQYELVFGQKVYTIKVKDFMPQEPKVTKTASTVDSEDNITWTVTVTNDEKPIEYEDGYTFTDIIGDAHTYVEGSLKKVGGDSITPDADGSNISWKYKDNNPSDTISFEYKTHVDFMALSRDDNSGKTINKEISNNITVSAPKTQDYDALSISAKAVSDVSKPLNKWVDKECLGVDNTGKASWVIKVNNNGQTLKNLVLHDKIVADSGVTIQMGSVTVVDSHGNNVSVSESTGDGIHNIAFTGDMTGTEEYTVTYETTIENFGKYLKENHHIPTNEAWLSYDYEAYGTGESVTVGKGPGIKTEFNGTGMNLKAAVSKSAAKIDRVNHTINWKIDVNTNEQELTNVVLTDVIPAGLSFEGIVNAKIAGSPATEDVDYTVDTSGFPTVKISFGDSIKGKKAYFEIVTKLTDAKSNIWASNATEVFKNVITLSSEGNDDVKDDATQTYVSEVIAKKAGSYDYSTHYIPYTITVNQNKMPMTNVVVTDPLDNRLEYVDGSSDFAGTLYDAGSNTITFNLGDITEEKVIKFKVKVKDGATFENNGKITINNEAGIVSAQYGTSTKVSAGTSFTNRVIDKKGVRNKEVINYTIELNVAGQNLYRSGINEVVIRDTMGASLVLDESTVKLYEASVKSDGSLKLETEVTGAVVRTDYSAERPVLEVVVPKTGASKAYILKYTAKMLKRKAQDFSNSVVLKGYGNSETNSAGVKYKDSDFANVDFSKYVYYISELVDGEDLTIIPGAHFELIDPSKGNKVVDEADSDEDGEIMFVGVLEENHEYILKETKAPEGYEIPKDLKDGISVHTKGKGYAAAVSEKENNRIVNNKPSENPGGGSGNSGNSSTPSNTSASTVRRKTIESLSDDSSLDNKKKLAKTGGFMGTLGGYASGAALMLAGFLVIKGSKKKEHED